MPPAAPTPGLQRDPMLSGEISAGRVRRSDEHEDSAHRSSLDGVIKRVSLDRGPAGVADQLLYARSRHAAARRSAGAMNDAFFDDGSVEVIGSKSQRDLCERW